MDIRLILPLLCLLAAIPLPAGESTVLPVSITGRTMGTTYAVKFLQPAAPVDVAALTPSIQSRLEQLDRAMSSYDPQSEICRFSAYPQTDWFAVSGDTVRVVNTALAISRLTDGTFDITIDPLVRLWGFGPQRHTGVIPDTQAIATAQKKVDYRKLEVRLQPPALRKSDPEISIDLSAIAKGYAADAVSRLLEQAGIADHLVLVGGESRARGLSQHQHPWHVGIAKPAETGNTLEAVVELNNQALSTSGDYRNFFILHDRRYAHIIDPRTGWPTAHSLAAVSIVRDTGAEADALATGLMVLGPETGYALALKNHWAALFILRTETGFVEKSTPAFDQLRQP